MTDLPTVDPELIRALATVLADADLTEIEIAAGDARIRLKRQVVVQAVAAPAMPMAAPAPLAPTTAPAAAPVTDDEDHPGAVTSPMVGVVYLSPEPGAPPYIAAGQQVAAGQTVLLIEAMKTFNQIKAPRAGTVSRLLVGSGEAVEYGQPLLVIE